MRKRDLDIRIAEELFGLKGVGYYGPTKAHGMHEDYKLMSQEDAYKAFVELWPDESQPNDVDGVELCSWQDGWGPIFVPEYSTWIADTWHVVTEVNKTAHGFKLEQMTQDWKATWILRDSGFGAEEGVVGFAGTPEAAICTAALEYCRYRGNHGPL